MSNSSRKAILIDIAESDDEEFATPQTSACKPFKGKTLYEDGNKDTHPDKSSPPSELDNSNANVSIGYEICNEGSDESVLFDGSVSVTMPDLHTHPIPTGGVTFEMGKIMELSGHGPATGTSRDTLPYSKRIKQKKGSFQCETCLKNFGFRHNLTQHQFTHLPKESYLCEWCGKSYGNKINLQKHMRRFQSKLKCSKCEFKCHKNLLPHDFCKKCPNQECTFVTQTHTIYLKHQLQCNGVIECYEPGCKTIFKSAYVNVIRRHNREFHNKYIV